MVAASVETSYFESCKDDLLAGHEGQFAVVCGARLVAVAKSLDLAFAAAGDAFGDGLLEDGAPILITEIARSIKVRVVAQPRAMAR